jgi:hypothetical protein
MYVCCMIISQNKRMLFSLLPEDPGGLNRWELISQQRELKIKWYLVLFLNVYLGLENVPWESVPFCWELSGATLCKNIFTWKRCPFCALFLRLGIVKLKSKGFACSWPGRAPLA